MNSPSRVITFVNAAHFIDHYAMLIFAAAVIIMGPALGMAYSELLPYATPGFVAFGAGSLITGWLGDWPSPSLQGFEHGVSTTFSMSPKAVSSKRSRISWFTAACLLCRSSETTRPS